MNAWQARRDADLLGPPKPETKAAGADKPNDPSTLDPLTGEEVAPERKNEADADAAKAGESTGDAAKLVLSLEGTTPEKTVDATTPLVLSLEGKEEQLPTLDQPDDNNRPKEDPQVDTALLFIRVKLLGILHPTLANAEPPAPKNTAHP